MMTRAWAGSASILLLLLAAESAPAREAGSDAAAMTAEEKARAADPAIGAVDGVILTEEVEWLETSAGRAKVWYHRRAKMLSEAGAALAAIEIPNVDDTTKIQKWWGHVLLQDGTGFALPLQKLDDHVDPKTGTRSITAKFSRAVPGCVVDWGYVVTGALLPAFEIVPLQRDWPVDRLSYRWHRIGSPDDGTSVGGYEVRNPAPGILVTRDNRGALLAVEHLPPASKRRDGRRATLVRWALHPVSIPGGSLVALTKVQERFWNDRAAQIADKAAEFAGKPERLRQAMQAIPIPADQDVRERLRSAYAWIDESIAGRSSKWAGTPGIAVLRTKARADKVLAARAGSRIDRTLLFLSIARSLGAEATLVLATDRNDWEWDRAMLLIEQFSHALIEVRPPGGGVDWVEPGSGLPFGEIPKGVAGGAGLEVTGEGARKVEIPGAGGG